MKQTYNKSEAISWPIPNYWDGLALLLVLSIIVTLVLGAGGMVGHYRMGQIIPIYLNPGKLPYYALRSVIRMLIAMGCSLIFTVTIGTLAAKNKHAERLLIPIIDILQSVPVLGYLSFTVIGFLMLFRGSMLGPECASIFVIFTAQVWNMTLSFYQSLCNVPEDLKEATAIFHLSAWQKFWRLEVPFAMPGLLWNMMLSMSGSWVFLVASEAISVANQHITLPGMGSFLGMAMAKANTGAVGYVILAMFVVILLYDQLFFRPLVAWGEKFKAEVNVGDEAPESWLLNLFHRTELFLYIGQGIAKAADAIINIKLMPISRKRRYGKPNIFFRRSVLFVWNGILCLIVAVALIILYRYIFSAVSVEEALHVLYLGLITAIRVMVVIIISSLIWVPVGVLVGLHPRASRIVQPLAQFLAAFPVNLLFPMVV